MTASIHAMLEPFHTFRPVLYLGGASSYACIVANLGCRRKSMAVENLHISCTECGILSSKPSQISTHLCLLCTWQLLSKFHCSNSRADCLAGSPCTSNPEANLGLCGQSHPVQSVFLLCSDPDRPEVCRNPAWSRENIEKSNRFLPKCFVEALCQAQPLAEVALMRGQGAQARNEFQTNSGFDMW